LSAGASRAGGRPVMKGLITDPV